jgi:hypothetical protein
MKAYRFPLFFILSGYNFDHPEWQGKDSIDPQNASSSFGLGTNPSMLEPGMYY